MITFIQIALASAFEILLFSLEFKVLKEYYSKKKNVLFSEEELNNLYQDDKIKKRSNIFTFIIVLAIFIAVGLMALVMLKFISFSELSWELHNILIIRNQFIFFIPSIGVLFYFFTIIPMVIYYIFSRSKKLKKYVQSYEIRYQMRAFNMTENFINKIPKYSNTKGLLKNILITNLIFIPIFLFSINQYKSIDIDLKEIKFKSILPSLNKSYSMSEVKKVDVSCFEEEGIVNVEYTVYIDNKTIVIPSSGESYGRDYIFKALNDIDAILRDNNVEIKSSCDIEKSRMYDIIDQKIFMDRITEEKHF